MFWLSDGWCYLFLISVTMTRICFYLSHHYNSSLCVTRQFVLSFSFFFFFFFLWWSARILIHADVRFGARRGGGSQDVKRFFRAAEDDDAETVAIILADQTAEAAAELCKEVDSFVGLVASH